MENGHELGQSMLLKYRATYLPAIAKRLDEENPGFDFTGQTSYNFFEKAKANTPF